MEGSSATSITTAAPDANPYFRTTKRGIAASEAMSIINRVEDALLLWEQGRYEGAFLSALVAVAATARKVYPNKGDRERFEQFLKQGAFARISVEYRGECHPLYHIFYKWFRCELVHEGAIPIDIEFLPDTNPGTVSVRAGGAPGYILKVSYGWFHELIYIVVSSSANAGLFTTAGDGMA